MLDNSISNGLCSKQHIADDGSRVGKKKFLIRIIKFLLRNINASHVLLMIKTCLPTHTAADSRIPQTSV